MDCRWILSVVVATTALTDDSRLGTPLSMDGASRRITVSLDELQSATKRPIALSQYVPDDVVFVGSHKIASRHVMSGLAEVLSDSRYRYTWTRKGPVTSPRYLLSRAPVTDREVQTEAERRLRRRLDGLPRYVPKPVGELRGNDAVPARYELIRSLPSDVRSRVVRTALSGTQVNLPLSSFDRNTLVAATGGVTMRRHSGEVSFSWREIASGNGYVTVHRTRLPDGNLGLRVSIRNGRPSGKDVSMTDGPTTDLIASGDSDSHLARNVGGKQADSKVTKQGSERQARGAGDDRITIRHDAPLAKDETRLANVLKQLAEESELAVVARWPDKYEWAERRLPESLVNVTVGAAIDRIKSYYHLEYRPHDDVIELRKTVVASSKVKAQAR